MYRGFRLFALAALASFLSFPASADAPKGWKEDENFKLLGREAYRAGNGGLFAIVEREAGPTGSSVEWFRAYIVDKLSKYTITEIQGPTQIRDAATGPVEGGYVANAILKKDKDQLVLMTFGVLIQEDAQVWQIFWDNKDVKSNPPLISNALNFLSEGGSEDAVPDAPKDINQLLAVLNKASQKPKTPKLKAEAAATEPQPFVAEPGQGVRNDALRGVAFDYGKRKMKTVWTADMPMRIATFSGAAVYVVFKDGWAYRKPSVAPADLNVAESRRVEPDKWIRWDDAKLHAATEIMTPLEKGTRIDISVQRPSTSSSSGTSVRSNWRSLTLTSEGRFETGSTSISSRQTGIDSSLDSSSNIVSSSGKDGTFSSVTGSYVTGGGMIQSQGTNRQSENQGNHSGAYFIDGNTIELRYDNGTITRAVFGFDGEREIIFGRTNYWVPKASE